MADNKPEQEPSIEEILASIRQIISDEEEPKQDEAPAPQPAAAAPMPEPEPEPGFEDEEDEDILELTPEMAEDDEEDINLEDYDVSMEEPTPPPQPKAQPAPRPQAPAVEEDMADILSETAKSAALSSMVKLAANMPVSKPQSATPRVYDGVTLEDIVRDLLHPLLRDWMDDNLPPMVERLVQKELEKLARRALDE